MFHSTSRRVITESNEKWRPTSITSRLMATHPSRGWSTRSSPLGAWKNTSLGVLYYRYIWANQSSSIMLLTPLALKSVGQAGRWGCSGQSMGYRLLYSVYVGLCERPIGGLPAWSQVYLPKGGSRPCLPIGPPDCSTFLCSSSSFPSSSRQQEVPWVSTSIEKSYWANSRSNSTITSSMEDDNDTVARGVSPASLPKLPMSNAGALPKSQQWFREFVRRWGDYESPETDTEAEVEEAKDIE